MIELAVDIASWACLCLGGLFYVIGAVGLNRMPDVFTRMHAVSVADTLGAGLLIIGMVLQAGPTLVAAKLILIILVLLFTGSVATHALARAALQDGVEPIVAGKDGKLTRLSAGEATRPLEELLGAKAGNSGHQGRTAPSKP